MMTIALVPDTPQCLSGSQAVHPPAFYMEDYSVLALTVDRFEPAVNLLTENGFLADGAGEPALALADTGDLITVVRLLSRNGIQGTISDVADDFYQG